MLFPYFSLARHFVWWTKSPSPDISKIRWTCPVWPANFVQPGYPPAYSVSFSGYTLTRKSPTWLVITQPWALTVITRYLGVFNFGCVIVITQKSCFCDDTHHIFFLWGCRILDSSQLIVWLVAVTWSVMANLFWVENCISRIFSFFPPTWQ